MSETPESLIKRIEAYSSQPKQPTDALSQISNAVPVVTSIAETTINNQTQLYAQQEQEITQLNLGQEETYKRKMDLADRNRLLGMVSRPVGMHQRALHNEIKNQDLISQGATDRIVEDKTLRHMDDMLNKAVTVEDYQVRVGQLKDQTLATLKTGASAKFNRTYDAYRKFAETYIPSRGALGGETDSTEFYRQDLRERNAKYLMDTEESWANPEPLSSHVKSIENRYSAIPKAQAEVRSALIDMLNQSTTMEPVDHVTSNFPKYFTQGDIAGIKANVFANAERQITAPKQYTPFEKEVRSELQYGRVPNIDPNLIKDDPATGSKLKDQVIFARDAALSKRSPEELYQFSAMGGYKGELASNISSNFIQEFDADFAGAARNRNVPITDIVLPQYTPGSSLPINKDIFRMTLRNRFEDVLRVKNQMFGGTDAIQHGWSADEQSIIINSQKEMNGDQVWNLGVSIFDTARKVNYDNLREGDKGIDPLFQAQRVMSADNQDKGIIDFIGLSATDPRRARRGWGVVHDFDQRSMGIFRSQKDAATAKVNIMLGSESVDIPESVKNLTAAMGVIEGIRQFENTEGTGNPIFTEGDFKVYSIESGAYRNKVIIAEEHKLVISDYLSMTKVPSNPNIPGSKPITLKEGIKQGKYKLMHREHNFVNFDIYYAEGSKAAAANLYEPFVVEGKVKSIDLRVNPSSKPMPG